MGRNTHPSALELALSIRTGDISPVEVIDETFDRIEELNDEYVVFTQLREEEARKEAREAARAVDSGDAIGPLHGVPIALKDLSTVIEGMPVTTGGSVAMGEMIPERTSINVQRLIEAGAIVVGSTNSPEFGLSFDTTNPMFGSTGNPFDLEKTAGGSSGGSAAAVVSGMVPIALGSDLAGSLRVPASACGAFGLKPSPGVVPAITQPDLFFAFAPFSTKGGITRTAEDMALLLDLISGAHARDPLSAPDFDVEYRSAVYQDIEDLSIAYSPDLGMLDVEPVVIDRVEETGQKLREAGATVDPVDIQIGVPFEEIRNAFQALSHPGLAASFENIKRDLGIDLLGERREELSPHLVEFAEHGREFSAVDFHHADIVRSRVYEAVQNVLDEYDLLLTPTTAVPPFEKGQRAPAEINGNPPEDDLDWALTWPFNLTGHPAASLPAGFTEDGLPIGAQIIGPRYGEDKILAVSAAIERQLRWVEEYPNLY